MKFNLLLLIIFVVLAGCRTEVPTVADPLLHEDDVILVQVDGYPISLPMLEFLMSVRGVDENDTDGMRQLLDELIRIRTVANAAENEGLADRQRVRAERMIKDMETLYVRYLEHYQQNHPVADEEIERAYREQVARAGDLQYRLRMVVYADQAQALRDMARLEDEGLSFDALAGEAEAAGRRVEADLWVDISQLPPVFAAEVAGTEAGGFVPMPLQTGGEWRLAEVAETRPMQPPPLAEVREGIRRGLVRERAEAMIEQHYQAADIMPMLPLTEVSPEATEEE